MTRYYICVYDDSCFHTSDYEEALACLVASDKFCRCILLYVGDKLDTLVTVVNGLVTEFHLR